LSAIPHLKAIAADAEGDSLSWPAPGSAEQRNCCRYLRSGWARIGVSIAEAPFHLPDADLEVCRLLADQILEMIESKSYAVLELLPEQLAGAG
jgi:hypothetical protein